MNEYLNKKKIQEREFILKGIKPKIEEEQYLYQWLMAALSEEMPETNYVSVRSFFLSLF